MDERLQKLRRRLVRAGMKNLKQPPAIITFTGHREADKLVNDLGKHPHAFVLACVMDRQIKAEKAWMIPFALKQRFGYFNFPKLAQTTKGKWRKAMASPTPLHRYVDTMALNAYETIQRIKREYHGDASRIWSRTPSSATVVRRMLEFDGVGPKISTMAANILVRQFHVPLSDYYSIDISVDVQVKRVLRRLGFVHPGASNEYVIYRARELNPEYPGIFDSALWELGRDTCRPKKPLCGQCELQTLCPTCSAGLES